MGDGAGAARSQQAQPRPPEPKPAPSARSQSPYAARWAVEPTPRKRTRHTSGAPIIASGGRPGGAPRCAGEAARGGKCCCEEAFGGGVPAALVGRTPVAQPTHVLADCTRRRARARCPRDCTSCSCTPLKLIASQGSPSQTLPLSWWLASVRLGCAPARRLAQGRLQACPKARRVP